ncbi:hypothetical protein GW17_00005302 [Ensete ventricosum]|nr:hypothetical protein GW17_00005302 [Ensete ventricosum]
MLIILTASITYVDYFEQIFAMLVSDLRVLICCFSFQRDTTGLSAENTELRLRLQAMEQQAQLHDGKHDLSSHDVFFSFAALNEALKQEVERLKLATGEISNPSGAYDGGLRHIPYNPSFASSQQQPGHHQAIQLQPQFQQSRPGASSNHLPGHQNSLPAMMEQDPIGGRLQGLGISKSSIVKLEGSSFSANGSRNL